MRHPPCLSDLVTRARRYRLSQADQARLDEHLSFCASCRSEQQLGADFDSIGALRPGDERFIAQLAEETVARLTRRPARRRYRRSLSVGAAVACALALFSAGAGAGVFLHLRAPLSIVRSTFAALDRQAGSGHRSPAPATVAAPAPPEPAASPLALPIAIIRTPTHAKALRPARSVAVSAPVPTAADAASLFASANRERRQAHAAAAISLYGELQRLYPASEEAQVSHVSLGRMLLEHGAAIDAMSQIDQYVATSPAGLLAPEALFARAQALKALGRRDEERSTWARLLAQFADSVYAAQARRRLEELR